MNFASWKIKAICAFALVAFIAGSGAGAGWWFTKTAYERDISALKEEQGKEREGWVKEKLTITTKAQKDTAEAIERMKAAQSDLAIIDAENQRKLADAENQNEVLRRDVAAGIKRLRLIGSQLAKRPAGEHSASGDPGACGVGDGAGIELSADAGQTVFDIRAGIISDQAKIAYLQAYVKNVVKQCKR